jgi:hypothetical protein
MKKQAINEVTPAQLDSLFKDLLSKSNIIDKRPPYNSVEHKDKTRSTIAKIFVWSYFAGLGIVFTLVLIYNLIILSAKLGTDLLNVKDVLLVFTSSVGSSLGFVVGYYFKGQEEKQ